MTGTRSVLCRLRSTDERATATRPLGRLGLSCLWPESQRRLARRCLGPAIVILLLSSVGVLADVELKSPGFPPSRVADDGTLVEPWGAFRLQILEPAATADATTVLESAPMPMAVTRTQAGAVTLTQSAYRSPVWPAGVDVVEAELVNTGDAVADVRLTAVVPEELELGESLGSLQGTPVLALPSGVAPVRHERAWGCVGGVKPLPGWAKPNADCDPAFRNIAAGMGGVPITYRFAVEPGGRRRVVLGFCESHHPEAGVRPLAVHVEGAEPRAVDPVGQWGQHIPGVERFDAVDADGDGRLQVTVAPHPRGTDRNTILNAVWVFSAELPIDPPALIRGDLNELAERYVDVGGQADQGLFARGDLKYAFRLKPSERRHFCFLLRCSGGGEIPDPARSVWDPPSLRKAAADVWRDRWDEKRE
jgi:hypothetical protein